VACVLSATNYGYVQKASQKRRGGKSFQNDKEVYMDKKISIIIPCYNVEKTIGDCMESLTSQTIGTSSMEIILVNDASTDNSLEKIYEWERKYPGSVIVINCTENGKTGQARNIGMQYASARYIGFVDDDDICEPGMFEFLYNAASKYNCDLAVCQPVQQKNHYSEINNAYNAAEDEIICIEDSDINKRISFLKRYINDAVWNKIYSRDLIFKNNIFFPAGIIYEDIFFSSLVKIYCRKVYISRRVLYHHILKPSSISKNLDKEQATDYICVFLMLIEELRQRKIHPETIALYDEEFIIQYLAFITHYEKMFGRIDDAVFKVIKQNIHELYPDLLQIPVTRRILENNNNPLHQKIIRSLVF